MAETSTVAAVLDLPADQLSIKDSSSIDSNSFTMASPSSAATSFELPSKDSQLQPSQALRPHIPPSSPLTFLTLPSDIHHLILTTYLPYSAIVSLRSTHPQFHSLIPVRTLSRLRRRTISTLLASERALLQKWLPQPYGRYNGRPTSHMTCYTCLQLLPTTSFLLDQVSQSRGLGRKRARDRWCKPCGLKQGKTRHGTWMEEVSYSVDDQIRYETVMAEELHLPNPCATCPVKNRYDGQHVWWGCVGCFEKEKRRLQTLDSDQRRDLRRHCSNVKRVIKAFVEVENLTERSQDAWRRVREVVGWHATIRRGYNVYWWVRDESLVAKAGRTCGRIGRVLDPRKMQAPGEKLGRKAKRAVGKVFELGQKKRKKKKDGKCGAGEGLDALTTSCEDCMVCCTDPTLPKEEAAATAAVMTITPSSPSSADHARHKTHIHIAPPHREVRCWRCWRAKRSRRRRRYDDGMAYGLPLPKERWCDGCQAEHEIFVSVRRQRKNRRDALVGEGFMTKGPVVGKVNRAGVREVVEQEEEEEVDVGLGGLFGEEVSEG